MTNALKIKKTPTDSKFNTEIRKGLFVTVPPFKQFKFQFKYKHTKPCTYTVALSSLTAITGLPVRLIGGGSP